VRGFFLPAVARACVGSECDSIEAGPALVETPAPTVSTTAVSIRPLAGESAIASDGAAVDERRGLFDAAPREDAMLLVAPASPSIAALRLVAPSASLLASPTDAATGAVPLQDASAGDARKDAAAGASAAQTGVRCGSVICPEAQVCCNASCSTCRPPGVACSQVLCGAISPFSVSCGPNTCNVGEVCCNASCGICTPPGGTCSQQRCAGVQVPVSIPCGPNTCNVGQVCCNASCGICTNPGETCRREPCP
jgi:hypothetical protein